MTDASILYSGKRYDISAVTVHGRCFASEFINQLEQGEQAKIISLLEYTGNYGPPKNREKFKKLEGAIWEFKSYQVRLLCFFDTGAVIIVTHGFRKKQTRTPKGEIERADQLRKQYLERKAK